MSLRGSFEFGAQVGLTLQNRLTEHYNLGLVAGYNLTDWWAIEARVGYAVSQLSSIGSDIQFYYRDRDYAKAVDYADLWQLKGHGFLGLRFQPIWLRFESSHELPVHLQVFVSAGAGVASLNKEAIDICAELEGSQCVRFQTEQKMSPLASAALGARIVLGLHHAIRFELRDWVYLDSHRLPQLRDRELQELTAVTSLGHLVQIELGYAFIF